MTARRPPAYTLHRPTGQARVRISGKDFYLGQFGTPESRQKYAALIAERGCSNGVPVVVDHDGLTVEELAAHYWQHAEQYYRKPSGEPTAHVEMIRLSLAVLRSLYGSTPAAEFGPKAFRALQQHLIDKGGSRNYINSLTAIVRRMFKWAASHELLAVTIHQAIATVPGLKKGRTAAREPGPVLPVAAEVVDATLKFLPDVVGDMVRLMRLTGARSGEIRIMRPADIDTSGPTWTYTPSTHKTEHHGRERRIHIGPQGQRILAPYLDRKPDAYCFSPRNSERRRREAAHARRKTPLSCGNRPGTNRKPKRRRPPRDMYAKDALSLAIRRAAKRAGVPHWHPHQLRHLFATECRRQYGLEVAQVLLGHARADITQLYAERDHSKAAAVIAEVG